MTPESRNSGSRARRPLLDNGSVIMFPQQWIRLKKQFIAYRVTSIPTQKIQKRFRSHCNEPPKHSKSERENSTLEGGDLLTVQPEPTSRRDTTEVRESVRSEVFNLCGVATITFRVLTLFVVTKCYSYSKIVLLLTVVPPGEYQIVTVTFRVLTLFVVTKCCSYNKIVLLLTVVPPGEYPIVTVRLCHS
jgi:hypothetical protein